MLYETPELDTRDHEILRALEDHRATLRHYLAAPRRWRGQLRRNLRARAMRGSNSIEGYDVTLDDAIALLADEETIDADQRTVLEVRGYRNAMTYVQQLASDPHFRLDQSLLRGLHFMMLGHDLSKSPGSYRQSEIFVRDEDRDEVVYVGPDHELVEPLMAELVSTLEATAPAEPVFVTGAMAHLNLVMIHPFRDGNGRMARGVQTMILARHQILTPEFSSIEEWLGRNTAAYYDVLAQTGNGGWNPGNDATAWVRFNLRAHFMQAQTVLRRVYESEDLWQRLADLVEKRHLTERVLNALYPAAMGLRIRRPVYQSDAEVETVTANRDLRLLVGAGFLLPRGETRGRYYLGTESVREIYASVRADHRGPTEDPYEVAPDALQPRRRVRTRVGGS